MDYVSYESYYLTDAELMVLLAGGGRTKWYGLAQAERSVQTGTIDDIHVILARLYQNEWITWEENKAVLLEPIRSIVKVLVQAQVCINVRKNGSRLSLRSHYIHENQVVFVERSQREAGMLRLTKICWEEWLELLSQESFFPEQLWEPAGQMPFYDCSLESGKTLLECCGEPGVYSGFERVDADSGKITERLMVKETDFVYVLHLQKEELSVCSKCEYAAWAEILQRWSS